MASSSVLAPGLTLAGAPTSSRLGSCAVSCPSPRLQAQSSRHVVMAAAEGSAARPVRPSAPVAPSPPSPQTAVTTETPSVASEAAKAASGATVSMEYQRQMAKELVAYFQEKKLEDISQSSQVFGWTRSNEIGNGRWVMFGLLVGLLTEYATGVDFPNQIALVLENLGIID